MWKDQAPHPTKTTITCEVIKNEHFTEDFLLTIKPEKNMGFKAGQFFLLHTNSTERPFSAASPPSDKNLQFLVRKHINGAVTPILEKLNKGEKIEISGPYGAFIAKPGKEDLIFVCTGTGIAPFRSMIPDVLEKDPTRQITLINGFRHECFFEDSWNKLAKSRKNFKLYGACSKPDSNWKGLKGHVTDHRDKIINSPKNKLAYICGSEAMVKDTKKILIDKCKLKSDQIKVEEWRDMYKDKNQTSQTTSTPTSNPKVVTINKKLKIGWFSFSCCEDSTIVFTELLNDHFEDWSKVIEFQHVRVLKSKNKLEGLDVAFVEGAIASEEEVKKVKEIRKNCKKLIAIGSCACNGMPSAQRNNFNKEQLKEIEFLIKKFHHAKKVRKLEEVIKVDGKVPGCPINEQTFLTTVDNLLKEFGVLK